MKRFSIVLLFLLLSSSWARAELVPIGDVELKGRIEGSLDLSGVETVGEFLAVVSDETLVVQMLEKKSDGRYRVDRDIPLLPAGSTEIDMEALAFDGERLYVLGSHAWARKKVRDDKSRAKNRERLATVKYQASRDHLFRLEIDPATGKQKGKIDRKSLRSLLANHAILHLFTEIPSKENGIDFEGLAVVDDRLYLGLRGPVLRGNHVPILSFAFDDIDDCSEAFANHPEECRLLFVDLDGRGVRSLHRVSDGFLLIAGPMGDGGASYQLYFWDGRDCVLDDGERPCDLELLGEVPIPDDAKAEGLTVLAETAEAWEILVVYDGAEVGSRFRVVRP